MVSLTIAASQPNGAKFRVALKCDLHLLVSWIAGLFRLF